MQNEKSLEKVTTTIEMAEEVLGLCEEAYGENFEKLNLDYVSGDKSDGENDKKMKRAESLHRIIVRCIHEIEQLKQEEKQEESEENSL